VHLFTHNGGIGANLGEGEKPDLFLKLSTLLGIVFRFLKCILTKGGVFFFSICICHINDNFSHTSGAKTFAEYQQTSTNNPSFPLQVPTLQRNNVKIFSENTILPLYRIFFFFKIKPALLFLGICSLDKRLTSTSLCSRAGVCPNKWDTPPLETVLLLISESVSFFSALNYSQTLPFYFTSFPICLPVS